MKKKKNKKKLNKTKTIKNKNKRKTIALYIPQKLSPNLMTNFIIAA